MVKKFFNILNNIIHSLSYTLTRLIFRNLNKFNVAKIFLEIYSLISRKSQLKLLVSFFLMVITGIFELFSLISVLPILVSLTSPEVFKNNNFLNRIIENSRFLNENNTFLFACLFIIFITILSSFFKILNVWISEVMTAQISSEISVKAYKKILSQNYTFHINTKSSSLIASLTDYLKDFSTVLRALLRMSTSIIIVTFLLLGLLILSTKLTLAVFLSFTLLFIVISISFKKRLTRNSKLVAGKIKLQIKLVQEGIGSIRDIILSENHSLFLNNYYKTDLPMRMADARNSFLSFSPKFGIEGIGIISIVTLTFFLDTFYGGSLSTITLIGTAVVASQKLLPSMQQIFNSWALINANIYALFHLISILKLPTQNKINLKNIDPINISKSIIMKNIFFSYSKNDSSVLKNINFKIIPGEIIGIVGQTGSGKSTLIDILMGLLEPSKGNIMLDNKDLYFSNDQNFINSWRKSIGHVPQDIFLIDGSFIENIALGEKSTEIDLEEVYKAARRAKISNFIKKTKYGFDTKVGERGINISGGQKQRLGIARALYKNPKILVLDEATSALDRETEIEVLSSINNSDNDLTIIMVAHRLSTLSNCDKIITIKNGELISFGSPKETLGEFN